MSNAHKEIYGFDEYRLDVSERILWRAGERVPLSEKAFETLCALVRRGNRLVSKDELLNEVWSNAVVEENNLDKNISLLRKILGERAGKGKFIETVRGHGFRFVADVWREETARTIEKAAVPESGAATTDAPRAAVTPLTGAGSEPPDRLRDRRRTDHEEQVSKPKFGGLADSAADVEKPAPPRRTRQGFLFAALFGTAVIGAMLGFYLWRGGETHAPGDEPIKTIAVLPFKSLGAESRNEALELGMADALIGKLSSERIIVRPLGSVSRYAALQQDSLAAGRALATEAVLDGTIQTANERIRISARLFRTSDGKQLWTGQFDEKFTDIFALQDSISEKVAAALQIRLGNREKKRDAGNIEAYQLYMKGRFYLLKATRAETETSISYFKQAVALDPDYALAHAGLADAYRGQTVGGEMPPGEYMPMAKEAALKAIALDDRLAEAHAVLGHVYFWYEWDWNAAERQHRRALELDPHNPDALQFYAHLLAGTGRHAEALARVKRARELDPLNLRVNAIEGMLLLYAGQIDEALDRLQKTLELNPRHRLALMMAARALSEKGMYEAAVEAANEARKISPESSEPIAYNAFALVKSGRRAAAEAALDELLSAPRERYVPPYNVALIYHALGENGRALEYLEKAFTEKDVRMVWLKVEPKWNSLRSEPRFISLMKRMNFD